ncbi:MAG: sulfurtransferase FdhD [Phenylobacterium sp.]|nr:sulfurtransferase FdhD [Phenylobacterium sp.]
MADGDPALGGKVSRPLPAAWFGEGGERARSRLAPEETPVALVHDAATTAVMMATPADLEDFAVGFSLTEGVVERPDQIAGLEIVEMPLGIEARIWLVAERAQAQARRRRALAGPTGCGLCGVESLHEALRPPARVGEGVRLSPDEIQAALAALDLASVLGAATRAVHAAGWWRTGEGLACIREDVGRHNALDKLVGALARAGEADRDEDDRDGALLLTSRVSVEMVQKAAVLGAQVLVAVSAPTALAVRTAEACGMTLAAVARRDGFEVFTRADRIGRR